MAAGELSADQLAYHRALVRGTGLHPVLAVAWIGSESGWNVTKAGHNYLNIGPGRTYPATSVAAADAVRLVTTSGHYRGIRDAIRTGDPMRQAAAIEASPWDAGHYGGGPPGRLSALTAQLLGGGASSGSSSSARTVPVADDDGGGIIPGWPDIGDVPDLFGGGIPGRGELLEGAMRIGLTVVFVAGALVLIVLGVLRLAGVDPKAAAGAAVGGPAGAAVGGAL